MATSKTVRPAAKPAAKPSPTVVVPAAKTAPKSPSGAPASKPKAGRSAATKSKVNPTPAGYHSITPYLVVDGGAKAIDFYVRVLGATELFRMPGPNGRIGHAEVKFGDSPVMLADEHPEIGARGPKSCGGSPVSILLYVPDVDKVVKRALAAGAKLLRPVETQFYGDRSGLIEDPFGHKWSIATHVEDLTPADIEERQKKAQQG